MTTPLQGWPEASLSDPANVPNYLSLGLRAAEKQAVMIFASAAARDAVLAGPNLQNGMVAYLQDTGALTLRFLGAWVNVRDPRQLGTLSFTDAATRNSVLTGGLLQDGMLVYLTTTKQTTQYDTTGPGWVILSEPTQTYTPTWTGITVAGPSSTGSYHRSDGYCDFQAKFIMGATPSAVGGVTCSLPVAAFAGAIEQGELIINYCDVGGFRYPGFNDPSSGSTSGSLYAVSASGSFTSNQGGLGLTVPFTWGVNDYISVRGRFRMATRYS